MDKNFLINFSADEIREKLLCNQHVKYLQLPLLEKTDFEGKVEEHVEVPVVGLDGSIEFYIAARVSCCPHPCRPDQK